MNLLKVMISVSFLFSIIRVTTPILYGAMCSLVSELCGVSNIGIEGIMLTSALTAVLFSAYFGGNAWIGLLAAVIIGVLISLLLGYIVMHLKANPIITGIAINLTASGATIFFLYLACGEKGISSSLASGVLPNMTIPILKDIPFIGQILSGHNILTYIGIIAIPLLSFFLYKTRLGLHIRSAGENPAAVASVGVNVIRTRYIALVIGGIFAALGGAFMSMGYVSYFVSDMIAGRGFIAIAASALGKNRPVATLIACLLFGAADAFAINPATQNIGVPTEIVASIPYIITIVALVMYSSRKVKSKTLLKEN